MHSNQITLWKRAFLAGADQVFSNKKAEEKANNELDKEFLYSKIGRFRRKLTFFKKKFWGPRSSSEAK